MALLDVCVIFAASISVCAAIEYSTLDTKYFKVEYPQYWNVEEKNVFNEMRYSFINYTRINISEDSYKEIFDPLDSYIGIGLNGADIRFKIDPNVKGMFDEGGNISESIIHFFESFQIKKETNTTNTVLPQYKTFENEYFVAEYPSNWIVYPNEEKYVYNFQIPIRDSLGNLTNVSWNIECYDPTEVSLGLNGATIDIQANKATGNFLEQGSINESLIHLLKTFKLKSIPTPAL